MGDQPPPSSIALSHVLVRFRDRRRIPDGGRTVGFKRRRRGVVAVLIVLAAVSIGSYAFARSSGGQSTHPSPSVIKVARPTQPIWCPTRSISPLARNAHTTGSFDARTLLGLPESKAAAETHHLGCSWRVVLRVGHSRDGHGHRIIVTADFRRDRVDATINHGIVTAVEVY